MSQDDIPTHRGHGHGSNIKHSVYSCQDKYDLTHSHGHGHGTTVLYSASPSSFEGTDMTNLEGKFTNDVESGTRPGGNVNTDMVGNNDLTMTSRGEDNANVVRFTNIGSCPEQN